MTDVARWAGSIAGYFAALPERARLKLPLNILKSIHKLFHSAMWLSTLAHIDREHSSGIRKGDVRIGIVWEIQDPSFRPPHVPKSMSRGGVLGGPDSPDRRSEI